MIKHWSQMEFLHQSVKNPNIILKGSHSYYSPAWTAGFEDYVVRYLYGDRYSLNHWESQWEVDQLHIGDYVCIGAEAVILMGGNNTHRTDWFSDYPFLDDVSRSYQPRGDTHIGDGSWIGMRAMIMPGVKIGEGAIIAANAVVTKDVAAYSIVGGNPAQEIKKRFSKDTIERLLDLHIYDLPEDQFAIIRPFLCHNDLIALEQAIKNLSSR